MQSSHTQKSIRKNVFGARSDKLDRLTGVRKEDKIKREKAPWKKYAKK
jgi:hypothetical protein